jgi:hypothetical protein
MASTHKSLRSGTANKRPTTSIADGQIALNTNTTSPGLFFKDSTGASIIKIGPVHVGATAPNVSPAAGGSSGNSTGEVWLDTSLTPVGVKIWNGSAWVNATPIGSTTVQGLLELATDAETQTGSDTARAVTPAGLQSKVSDSTSTTSSTTIASSTAVKSAYDLANAALPKSGGTITGNLEIGTTGSLSFEGATADAFETTIAVTNPTADRTITLPDTTGTIVTTGDTGTVTSTMLVDGTIVNGDINASAAIAHSKLANITAGSVLLGNATNVPTATALSGDVTVNSSGVTAISSGVIVDADINASAAIGDTKLATIATADKVSLSALNIDGGTDIGGALADADLFIVDDGGAGTNRKAAATRITDYAFGKVSGDITIGSTGTAAISSGVIVNADVNASAAIAGTKISPDFGSQNITTTGLFSHALGTAGAPTITFTGDTNTGIYSPGADQVAISTNGTGQVFINSNGNLGVGTLSATNTAGKIHARADGDETKSLLVLQNRNTGGSAAVQLTFINGGVDYADDRYSYIRSIVTGAGQNGNNLTFATNPNGGAAQERLRITSDGKLGLGTSSPSQLLHAQVSSANTVFLGSHNNTGVDLYANDSTGEARLTAKRLGGAGGKFLSFYTDTGSAEFERARIDSSGRLLVGTSNARANLQNSTQSALAQVEGTDSSSRLLVVRNSADNGAPEVYFAKSRGSTSGSNTLVSADDFVGGVVFAGSDGTEFVNAAFIGAQIDGTPGANDMPGRLVFSTTADGASSPTEALRITNDRVIAYNQGAPVAVNATATLTVANLKTGIITSTSAAATDMTLPTGTLTEGGFSGIYTNMAFEWSVINTGPSLVRVLAGTDHTLVGSGSVATGTSGRFASRRTAANTFVTYRLS